MWKFKTFSSEKEVCEFLTEKKLESEQVKITAVAIHQVGFSTRPQDCGVSNDTTFLYAVYFK